MSSYRRRLLLANQLEEYLVLYGNSVQDGTPTPEAPIDIMSIENPTIKVTGDNLIKPLYESGTVLTYEELTVTYNNDGSVTLNGSTGSNNVYPKVGTTEVTANTTYILHNTPGSSGSTFQLYTYYAKSETEQISYIGANASSTELIIPYINQTLTWTLTIWANATFDNITVYPMLNEGTEALPYEPYEEELITIDETTPFGKNLIPYPPYSRSSVYVDNKNGTYGVNGTLKAGAYYGVNIIGTNLGDYLEHGKYYTMSLEGLNIPDGFKSIGLYIRCINKETSANAWPHQCFLSSNGFTKASFYVDKDKYDYQELFIQINPVEADLTVSDMLVIPMLNEGKEALPFEPYIQPVTTMRGIGDYKDRIYTKDGKVWFEKNIHYLKPSGFSRRGEGNRMIFASLPHPNDYGTYSSKKSNFGKYNLNYAITNSLHWYLAKVDDEVSQIWLMPASDYSDLWATKEEAWVHLTETLGIYPEFQYPLATPIITEITGALAEKILAIDKSKNITIYSDNGVYGNTEIVED